jgi:hypothetical protein
VDELPHHCRGEESHGKSQSRSLSRFFALFFCRMPFLLLSRFLPLSNCLIASLPCSRVQPFQRPVRTKYGHFFERRAILEWIDKHHTCPLTRQPLRRADLSEDAAFRHRVRAFLAKS